MTERQISARQMIEVLEQSHILVGDPEASVRSANAPADATFSDVAFCLRGGDAGLAEIERSAAGIIVAADVFSGFVSEKPSHAIILVPNPRLAQAHILSALFVPPRPAQIHQRAFVASSASIGVGTYVGPNAVVDEDVVVGQDCTIHANAVLMSGTRLGDRVVIQPGAIIGGPGFVYESDSLLRKHQIPGLGGVLIEDDVEVGSATCVDRGTFGDTVLRTGCKIDNLVHVAHDVEVGPGALVVAGTVLGGWVKIGANAFVGIGVSVKPQARIGAETLIGMNAVVAKDIPDSTVATGSPARVLRQNHLGREFQPPGASGAPDDSEP